MYLPLVCGSMDISVECVIGNGSKQVDVGAAVREKCQCAAVRLHRAVAMSCTMQKVEPVCSQPLMRLVLLAWRLAWSMHRFVHDLPHDFLLHLPSLQLCL